MRVISYFDRVLGMCHRPSFDLISHRYFPQMPSKKRADDDDSHVRTSSVSSSSVPTVQPSMNHKFTLSDEPSGNVKVKAQ